MISESQERMVAITARPEDVGAICDKWELAWSVIGEVTDTGELRAFHDGELVGEIPAAAADRRVSALRRADAAEGDQACVAPARAQPPQPRVDLRALRPAGRVPHGPPPRPRRGGAPAAAVVPRPGRLARRAAGRRARSISRGRARRARRGAECRLRRRRADRAHRLPQLRQPGEAGDRLGARAGDRGDLAGGRGARHPGRLRKRLALQRHRRPLDPADPGRRLRRPRRGRALRASRLAFRRHRLGRSRAK